MDKSELGRLLASATCALENNIVAEIGNESNKITLDMCIRVINYVAASLKDGDAAMQSYQCELLGSENVAGSLNDIQLSLAAEIPDLMHKAMSDGDGKEQSLARLQKIFDVSHRYLATLDPDIDEGSAVVYKGGRISRDDNAARQITGKPINRENLKRYFEQSGMLPDFQDLSDVQLLTGGFSKVTALFTATTSQGQSLRLAMRKDLKVPLMGASVVDEYPYLTRLAELGFQVPRPYGLEADARYFDGAFIISEAVSGNSSVGDWSANSQHAAQVTEELALLMAKFHSYPLRDFSADANDISAGDAMEQEISKWEALYSKRTESAEPLLEIALAWLKSNIPSTLYQRRASLVHGDIGFHNLMVDEGRITGILDWEFAHIGDAVEDLAYLKPFIDAIGYWDLFHDSYTAHGGTSFTEQEQTFYKVWSFTRNPIGTLDARWIFKEEMPEEVKLAVSGTIFRPYLELDAARSVLEIIRAGSM